MERITRQEVQKLSHNFQVRFALFCTYQVKDRWDKTPSCIEAVKIVELWLDGRASSEECRVAAHAADCAVGSVGGVVVSYTAFAAANVSNAGACAADYNAGACACTASAAAGGYAGTSKDKVIKEQWDFYNELLHFDEIVEKALLGEEI